MAMPLTGCGSSDSSSASGEDTSDKKVLRVGMECAYAPFNWTQVTEDVPDGSKAVLTDFFAAAFNPTTGLRYFHVITAALVMGGLVALSIAAYHYLKGKNVDFAKKTMKTGIVVALVATCALFVSAHSTAVGVWEQQPTKLAAMLPGFTSFLATFTFDTVYPGLNSLAETEQYGDLDTSELPVNAIFQSYHLMVAVSGILLLLIVIAIIAVKTGKIQQWKWFQKLLVIAPIFPLAAIEAGWFTAELGRQPWVVYPSAHAPDGIVLLTNEAVSKSVSAPELLLTIVLFCVIYLLLFVAWGRLAAGIIKAGPDAMKGDDLNIAPLVDKISGDVARRVAIEAEDGE